MSAFDLFGFFAMRHDKQLTEDIVRRILAEAGAPTVPATDGGRPLTAEDTERYVELVLSRRFEGGIPGFTFHRQSSGNKSIETPVIVALHNIGSFSLENGKIVRIKPFQREPWKWCAVIQGNNALHLEKADDAAWFLDRVRPTIAIFEPSFAFADVRKRMFERIGDDPQRVAWPLMIVGPSEVERIGKEKLLDAPAWKIEQLSYGGIWIQVAENPFTAADEDVAKLAKHLGIVARKEKQDPEDWLK